MAQLVGGLWKAGTKLSSIERQNADEGLLSKRDAGPFWTHTSNAASMTSSAVADVFRFLPGALREMRGDARLAALTPRGSCLTLEK